MGLFRHQILLSAVEKYNFFVSFLGGKIFFYIENIQDICILVDFKMDF